MELASNRCGRGAITISTVFKWSMQPSVNVLANEVRPPDQQEELDASAAMFREDGGKTVSRLRV